MDQHQTLSGNDPLSLTDHMTTTRHHNHNTPLNNDPLLLPTTHVNTPLTTTAIHVHDGDRRHNHTNNTNNNTNNTNNNTNTKANNTNNEEDDDDDDDDDDEDDTILSFEQTSDDDNSDDAMFMSLLQSSQQQQQQQSKHARIPLLSSSTNNNNNHNNNHNNNNNSGAELTYKNSSAMDLYLHRVGWLIGLLILQSFSSFILASFEKLLEQHIIITLFLTMLVGSGGNAGSQSTVAVVRGIATGDIPRSAIMSILTKELKIGFMLSGTLGCVGFGRVFLYRFFHPISTAAAIAGSNTEYTSWIAKTLASVTSGYVLRELLAISLSLTCIVFVSVLIGTMLPLFLHYVLRVDGAHAGPTVQVTMDILGVLITCLMSTMILPSSAAAANATTT